MRKKAIESTQIWNKNINVGDKIEGVYEKTEVFTTRYGESIKYVIDVNGEKYGVYGSASLNRQFKNVPEGSYVWIEYKGEETSKNGQQVKVYVVEYDDEVVNAG